MWVTCFPSSWEQNHSVEKRLCKFEAVGWEFVTFLRHCSCLRVEPGTFRSSVTLSQLGVLKFVRYICRILFLATVLPAIFFLVWLPKDNDSKYHIWDNGSKLELPIKRTKWILTYDQAFEMPFNSISYICWLFMTLLYQNNQPISNYLLQNGTWYWVEVQAKPRFEHHPDPVVYVNIHDSTVLACTVCIFWQWLFNSHIDKHSFDQSFSSIMSIEHEPIGRVIWLDGSAFFHTWHNLYIQQIHIFQGNGNL